MQESLPNKDVDRVVLRPQGSSQSSPGTMVTGSMIQRIPSRNELANKGPLNSETPVAVNISRVGGGSMRRKPTRRTTQRRPKVAYEEEEGYVSEEYDDSYELSNIRVKVRSIVFLGDFKWFTAFVAVALPRRCTWNDADALHVVRRIRRARDEQVWHYYGWSGSQIQR